MGLFVFSLFVKVYVVVSFMVTTLRLVCENSLFSPFLCGIFHSFFRPNTFASYKEVQLIIPPQFETTPHSPLNLTPALSPVGYRHCCELVENSKKTGWFVAQ